MDFCPVFTHFGSVSVTVEQTFLIGSDTYKLSRIGWNIGSGRQGVKPEALFTHGLLKSFLTINFQRFLFPVNNDLYPFVLRSEIPVLLVKIED